MAAGLLLIVAALCFVVYNTLDSRRAGEASDSARQALLESMESRTAVAAEPGTHIASQTAASDFAPAPTAAADTAQPDTGEDYVPAYVNRPSLPDTVPAVPVMPTVELDGSLYIGILEIPSLSLSLPVMENWDYDKLKIAPCRYSGSYYMNDLVICGHNYAKHFASLLHISIGADVYFTNMDGQVIHYVVTNRETVWPTQVDVMIDNTLEGWDLTLFTCYTGGQTRCAVRCTRVED